MDLASGIVSVMCRKLRNFQNELRIEQNQPSRGEWLGDQALKVKSDNKPAYIRYKDWTG